MIAIGSPGKINVNFYVGNVYIFENDGSVKAKDLIPEV